MSNKISRRTFLKCTGASAAALGTAALLGGCQSSSNASVEVKVGDKVSNWNNLGVQLTSVFTLTSAPDVPGHEYVAVLVTAVNRSSSVTFNIGAPNIAEINAAYPLDTDAPSLPPQRSGYIELVCMVPTGWQQITVTYTPTFVTNKTLTFSLSASDVAKA